MSIWFVLIIPVIMIISGWMMWKHCPKRINSIYGYRTKRSMKNMDTWKFAHEYCGKLWAKWGILATIISALIGAISNLYIKDLAEKVSIVLIIIQCLILVLTIIPTELALKKRFDEDGKEIKD